MATEAARPPERSERLTRPPGHRGSAHRAAEYALTQRAGEVHALARVAERSALGGRGCRGSVRTARLPWTPASAAAPTLRTMTTPFPECGSVLTRRVQYS